MFETMRVGRLLASLAMALLVTTALGCSDDAASPTADQGRADAALGDLTRTDQATTDGPTNKADGGGSIPDGLIPDTGAFVCDPPAQSGELWALSGQNLRTVSLCEFRGQVILIVNIAAKCGYTPQLGGLATMHKKYETQGFTVLGFYSNQFLQAGNKTEQDACESNYGVTFTTFYDVNVNPPNEDPVFTWLKAQPGGAGPVLWNFEKFLIDRSGKLVARWATAVPPEDAALVAKVEATIAQAKP